MKLPEFSSTQEALCWGMAYYGDKLAISALYQAIQNITIKFDKTSNIKECFKLAFCKQFLRESLETATGKIQVKDLQYIYPEVLFFDFD